MLLINAARQNKLILIEILVCNTIFHGDNYYPYDSVITLLLLDATAQVLLERPHETEKMRI
jgi:hypothetical protein